MLGGGDGRDAINCVSTAKHKKGRTRFIKGANTNIERANTRFAPTVCALLNGLYWVIGGWGLCGAQKCRGNPCDCPDVDEAICSALLVVNCLYGR